MANPFETKFDSECQECGSFVWEGDLMYSNDGTFLCKDCATLAEIVCACGNFKKDTFKTCFDCNKKESEDDSEEWNPWK